MGLIDEECHRMQEKDHQCDYYGLSITQAQALSHRNLHWLSHYLSILYDDTGSDSIVNCTYVFTLLMSLNDLCGGRSGDICVKGLCRLDIVHLSHGISVWCSELGRCKVLTHKPVVLHKQNVIVL